MRFCTAESFTIFSCQCTIVMLTQLGRAVATSSRLNALWNRLAAQFKAKASARISRENTDLTVTCILSMATHYRN